MSAFASPALLLAFLVAAAPGFAREGIDGLIPPDSAASFPTAWIPAPGDWEAIEGSLVRTERHGTWRIGISSRRLGMIIGGRADQDVTFPRVEFRRLDGDDTSTVAVIIPTGNREISILSPRDPRLDAVPLELIEDPLGRWPNVCNLSILDATGSLDLDRDGIPEIALRRFCSCPASACAGLEIVELSASGPEIIDPSALSRRVSLGRVTLLELIPGSDPARPILRVAPDYLEECRFVSLLAIRGSNDCPGCCRFPVLLRVAEDGGYEPYYDAHSHGRWLQRAKDDLNFVAAQDPGEPLRSLAEAQLCRAAAFFYLTGSGPETRRVVEDALGARARQFRVQDLLRRLDGMFLAGASGPR